MHHTTVRMIKNNLKYTTVLIGLILFTGQLYFAITEKENINIDDTTESKTHTSTSTLNPNTISCDASSYLFNIFAIVFKCSLAFLAGGLVSDMKFIKFGVL
jgi:hypothetical protein